MKKLFISFLLVFLLSGCMSIPLSQQNKASLHTINAAKEVEAPKYMDYESAGSLFSSGFGAAGLLVAEIANEPPREAIEKTAKDHNISVSEIVRAEFINELKQKTPYKIVSSETANANLLITINSYGFKSPPGFNSKVKPILIIDAKLVTPKGIVIWREEGSNNPFDADLPYYSNEELYSNNGEKIREAWTIAAKRVISKMIKTLE